jgi:hypothetical protein
MNLPKMVTLHAMPDGYNGSHYPLTLGKEYKVHGEMGSCVIIEADDGARVSVNWTRFVPTNIVDDTSC